MKKDKVIHFIVGLVVSLITGLVFHPFAGLTLALLVGVIKEYYDSEHKENHTAEFLDFVATFVGGFVAMVVLLCL